MSDVNCVICTVHTSCQIVFCQWFELSVMKTFFSQNAWSSQSYYLHYWFIYQLFFQLSNYQISTEHIKNVFQNPPNCTLQCMNKIHSSRDLQSHTTQTIQSTCLLSWRKYEPEQIIWTRAAIHAFNNNPAKSIEKQSAVCKGLIHVCVFVVAFCIILCLICWINSKIINLNPSIHYFSPETVVLTLCLQLTTIFSINLLIIVSTIGLVIYSQKIISEGGNF